MKSGLKMTEKKIERCEVVLYSEATLPTRSGEFRMLAFRTNYDEFEHLALIFGELGNGSGAPLTRVHSECLTGEVFGSLRCDCKSQLELAMERIAYAGSGLIVYLRQEGRGIGLGNKLKAYNLQDNGVDTYSANEILGFPADMRRYDLAAAILAYLGVAEVRLMTNNPAKVRGVEANGIKVVERVPILVAPNEFNIAYLRAKHEKQGHIITNLSDGKIEPTEH
ncbi:MAG: hypothetical protein Kow0090_02510 [Myxococcota bacterium]